MNKKVLYFHGLGGEPNHETSSFFGKFGIQTIQMYHDYELEWNFDSMYSFIRKQVFIANLVKPSMICGTSYGGYIAYNLAKMINLPCLLINPALDRDLTKTTLKHIDFPLPMYKDNLVEIYLGKQDELVPGNITKNFIKKDHTNYKIIELNGEHNVDGFFWMKMLKSSEIINPKKTLDIKSEVELYEQLQRYFGKKRIISESKILYPGHIIIKRKDAITKEVLPELDIEIPSEYLHDNHHFNDIYKHLLSKIQ